MVANSKLVLHKQNWYDMDKNGTELQMWCWWWWCWW